MGLAEVQAALARLFTDADFRASFFADPIEVGRNLGLDESETTGLAALSTGHVAQFAASLLRKRVADLRKILPLTSLALGDSFAPRFREAVEGIIPPPRRQDDARSLIRHLGRLNPLDPPWAADLARYELAFLGAARMRAGIIIRRFHYPVARLAASVHLRETIKVAVPRFRLGIWVRVPGWRGIVHRLW